MFCTNCGQQLHGAAFCTACGHPADGVSTAEETLFTHGAAATVQAHGAVAPDEPTADRLPFTETSGYETAGPLEYVPYDNPLPGGVEPGFSHPVPSVPPPLPSREHGPSDGVPHRRIGWVIAAAAAVAVVVIGSTVWIGMTQSGDRAINGQPQLPPNAREATAPTTPSTTDATSADTASAPADGSNVIPENPGGALPADGPGDDPVTTENLSPTTESISPQTTAMSSSAPDATDATSESASNETPPAVELQTYEGPGGLAVEGPPGWTSDTSSGVDTVIDYVEPGAESRLSGGHFRLGIANLDGASDFRTEAQQSADYVRKTFNADSVTGPTYFDFLGTEAADIEYEYFNAATGTQRHNIERIWHHDGHTYIIESAGRADQWEQTLDVFTTLIKSAQLDG